jgi:hypothetical protein
VPGGVMISLGLTFILLEGISDIEAVKARLSQT